MVRSSSVRWSRPDEAEPAAELADFHGGAVLRGGGLLLLLLVLSVVRLSTPARRKSPGGCAAGAVLQELAVAPAHVCASQSTVAMLLPRCIVRPFDSQARRTQHALSGVPSTAVDVPARALRVRTHIATLRVGGLVKETWPIVSCMRGVSMLATL